MLFRRVVSNLIDIVISLVILWVLYIFSGLEYSKPHFDYFYLVTFILIFAFPIFITGNTLGKQILGLYPVKKKNYKAKAFIKYLFYFLLFLPTFHPFQFIFDFPLLNPDIFHPDFTTTVKLALVYIITDSFIFILSLGKFHLLDYILHYEFSKYEYQRNFLKGVAISFLFFLFFLIASVYQFRYNFSFSDFSNTFLKSYFKEHYPQKILHGNKAFVVKDFSKNVILPSEPLSLIFDLEFPRKTIYIHLPLEIFNSEEHREEIAYELLFRSLDNDVYYLYEPRQTRIVMSSGEYGLFLDYTHYTYYYYFDHKFPEWAIYGGIKTDSLTDDKYISAINNLFNSRHEKLERKYGKNWRNILDEISYDSIEKENLDKLIGSYNISTSYTYADLTLTIDTTEIKLKRISLDDVQLHGYKNINFPYRGNDIQLYGIDFLNQEMLYSDQNVEELKFIIRNYSAPNL